MRAQNIVLKSKTPMSGGPPSSPIKASSPIRISKEAFTRRAEVKGALAVRTKGGYDKGCTGFQAAAKEAGGMIRMQCLAEKEPGLNRSPQYQMLMWALLQVYGEDTTQPHCSGAVMHTGVPLRNPAWLKRYRGLSFYHRGPPLQRHAFRMPQAGWFHGSEEEDGRGNSHKNKVPGATTTTPCGLRC